MPILRNAKTVYVDDKPWSSPDGKVTIWTIKLEVDGERNTQSTMSKAIATEGFQGDVEIYTNQKGKDYVRQAPKEDFGSNARTPDDTQDNIARSVALKAAVDFGAATVNDKFTPTEEQILVTADKFLAWLQNMGSPSSSPAVPLPSGSVETKEEKSQPARDYVSEEEIPPEVR